MKKTKKTKKSEIVLLLEKEIEMTKPNESQKVVVKGTGKSSF
jgi:hypothetical protein